MFDSPEFTQLLVSLWYGILAAMFYALIGYGKRREGDETFNGEIFLTSALIGIVAGFIAFWKNISPQDAVVLVLSECSLVYIIEGIAKIIWRRVLLPWQQKPAPPPATPTPS